MYNYNPQPVNAQPRIGDWLSETFNLFGQQAGVWCLQGFLAFVIMVVPMVILWLVMFGFMASMGAASNGSPSAGPPLGMIFGLLGFYVVIILAANVVTVFMTCGMLVTAARQIRGEPISVGDLFSGGRFFFPVLVETLLGGLAAGIGALFCIVPGLMLGGLFCLGAPIAVEEHSSGTNALSRSWEVTKPYMWWYVLWQIVIGMISSIGMQLLGLGWPLLAIGQMVAYKNAVGMAGALPGYGGQMVAQQQFPQREYGAAGAPVAGYACPRCHRQLAVGAVACPFCEARLG